MLNLVTPPAVEPVSVADVKAHLRVDIDDDDTLLGGLITAAREWCEMFTWRAFIEQTWDYGLGGWPARAIAVPRPNLLSVTSVTYYDEANASAVFNSANYYVDTLSKPGRIVLNAGSNWPSATLRPVNGVIVRFVAGFGDEGTDVPEAIRTAIKLLVGDLYENRESTIVAQGVSVVDAPFGVKALLMPYRMKGF